MESYKTHIALALLLSSLTQVGANEAIDTQIQAIKDADPQERRELINRLKQDIAQMNKNEQSNAVTQMRLQLKTMNQEKMVKAEKTQNKEKQEKEAKESHLEKEQKRIQKMQQTHKMQQTQQMQQMENMNQKQGANQFSQEIRQSNMLNQGFGKKGKQ